MFAQRLKELRLENGLSQQELAEKLNISGKTVSGYENNVSQPNLDLLKEIARLFNVSVDYLIGYSNYKNKNAKKETNAFFLYIKELFESMDNKSRETFITIFKVLLDTYTCLAGTNNNQLDNAMAAYFDYVESFAYISATAAIITGRNILFKKNEEDLSNEINRINREKTLIFDETNDYFSDCCATLLPPTNSPVKGEDIEHEYKKIVEKYKDK